MLREKESLNTRRERKTFPCIKKRFKRRHGSKVACTSIHHLSLSYSPFTIAKVVERKNEQKRDEEDKLFSLDDLE